MSNLVKFSIGIAILIFVLSICGACKNETEGSISFASKSVKGESLQLTGILSKPDGKGPFPAVILLHPCPGLDETVIKHLGTWANRLKELGYISLILDSFGPRGLGNLCEDTRKVSCSERALDAYSAKSYLSRMKIVDPKRIAVIGWSHGGWSVMAIVDARIRQRDSGSETTPFQAAIAFYPYCQAIMEFDTPLLILVGERDQWVPPGLCEDLKKGLIKENNKCELKLIIYPGAHHCFDMQGTNETYLGYHLEYNPAATEDAALQVKNFLAKYLARAR